MGVKRFKITEWPHRRVKGLTLAEVLVTLALTSVVVTLAYTGLNYVQKLYAQYRQQTRFIQSLSHLQNRLQYEGLKARYVLQTTETEFQMVRDSAKVTLKLLPESVITTQGIQTDTFYVKARQIERTYQPVKNPLYAGRLIQSLSFQCEFTKQKFNIYFYKPYDASVLLELEGAELSKQN